MSRSWYVVVGGKPGDDVSSNDFDGETLHDELFHAENAADAHVKKHGSRVRVLKITEITAFETSVSSIRREIE